MKILLIGSGGREHAFAYKLVQSKHCKKLFIMPGNAGTESLGENVNINPLHFDEVGVFCINNQIDLVVVGPEEPLVKGLKNYFIENNQLQNIAFVGPDKYGAVIEGSKDWSKNFMIRYNIPTATYKTFTEETLHDGKAYIENQKLPVVLKADGLAAGKGVLICNSHSEAVKEYVQILTNKKFGEAGNKVVVEEFLSGIECSVFVVTDGTNYKILPVAKDYKRIGEGDTGLNTGGMGAICPVPFADDTFMQLVEQNIVIPTINGLRNEGIHYTGFIFIGLMKVNDLPYVIEYNCRMGDPETEVVLPLIESDFAEMMLAVAKGNLANYELKISNNAACTIMLVSKGYPENYEKGKIISGLNKVSDSIIFHAGTKVENNQIVSNGGRVMAITSIGSNINAVLQMSLKNAEIINFENKYYRKDIGYEFLQ